MAAYLRYVKRRYVKNGKPTSQQYAIKSAMRPLKVLYAETPATDFGSLALKAVRERVSERMEARYFLPAASGERPAKVIMRLVRCQRLW